MTVSLALCLTLVGALQFSVDWAVFRATEDSSRVDFFYAVPYDQLLYVDSAGGPTASFAVAIDFRGIDNSFAQSGQFSKRASLGPGGFAQAAARQRTFVDGFSIVAPAGRYRFEMTITDSSPAGRNSGTVVETLVVGRFGSGFGISSLQLGARVVTDSFGGRVSVLPHPSRRFGAAGFDTLYFYYEGYGLSPDTGEYGLETWVLRRGERVDTVVQSGLLSRPRSATTVGAAFGLEVASLGPGEYELGVALTDFGTGQTVRTNRPFVVGEVVGPAGPAPRLVGLGEREQRYYREISYIATPRQLAYYQALSDSGKEAWLAQFWSQHNLTEFARRMETAAERFRRPKESGLRTDRGRIYVKYGEPDAIEQKVIESGTRPREYWHYYGIGYRFVFVDIRGDGNFRLVWTNAKEEPPTGLEHYLSAEEQAELR